MKIGEYEEAKIPVEDSTINGFVNKVGDYVGDQRWVEKLTELGISAIKSEKEHCVCSIGFSEKQQKWYGWSHRAMYGFGIGHVVKEGSCEASSGWTEEYLKKHKDEKPMPVGFECKNLDDCKKCAIAFASSVS